MRILRLMHNGHRSRTRVLVCETFVERAKGLLGVRKRDASVLKIEPCAAVHTCGMRVSIDVAFTDFEGRVLRCVSQLKPWRIARCPRAHAAWEMRAGHCRALAIRPGDRLQARPPRERGAATVEFGIVALTALMPCVFGILELAQLAVARHTVNYATFLTARAGAVEEGARQPMLTALALGLAPLYAGPQRRAPESVARALIDANRPDRTHLVARRFVPPEGGDLLAVHVRICRSLLFPVIDRAIVSILRRNDADPFAQGCYLQRAVVIGSRAIAHMQSRPRAPPSDTRRAAQHSGAAGHSGASALRPP